MERSIYLIDHSKRLKTHHLNGNKLYLNRRGAPSLQNTVFKFLSKIFNRFFEENNVEITTVSSTTLQSDEECKSKACTENINMDLKFLRLKNVNKLIITHLNINSLRNKVEFLISLIKDNIDILII